MRFPCILLASSVMLLAGCSIGPIASNTSSPSPTPTPTPASVVTIKGILHGGENPIVGARVYMYAVTIGAYGQPSTSLMQGGGDAQQDSNGVWYVPTDTNGNFSISADDYYCTSNGETAVYLYGTSGTPKGLSQNLNAGLMAVLGSCSAPTGSATTGGGFPSVTGFVIMNEVTTVAAAYSLAGFATDPTHISGGVTSQGATAVLNAANNAFNLASLTTFVGQTPALTQTPGNPNSVVPQAEIDSLADALAACVSEASGACSTLQQDTTNNPTNFDTAAAAIYIARHPGVNVSGIFCLIGTSSAPFQPILPGTCSGGAPNDWTIAITYTQGGLNTPSSVAVDGLGNVWVANSNGNSVSAFGPNGTPLQNSPFSGSGLANPSGIAIDTAGNAWVVNSGASVLSEFSSTGSVVSPPGGYGPYTPASVLQAPYYLAVDGSNNIWVTNNGSDTVSEFTSGANDQNSPVIADDTANLEGVAADPSGNLWVVDNANSNVIEFPGGILSASSPPVFSTGASSGPQGIAVDAQGNVWVPNYNVATLTELAFTAGSPPTYTNNTITGGGLAGNSPYATAVDGAGNVWVMGSPGPLAEFTSGGSPIPPSSASNSTGYGGAILPNAFAFAIDSSGNVWVAQDSGFGGTPPDSLVEFVGAAAPVVTPLSVYIENAALGTQP